MTDLRTRIAAVQRSHTIRLDYSHPRFGDCRCGFKTGAQEREGEDFDEWWWERHAAHVADAVIRELPELTALRRCERCRIPCLPDEYPPMSEGGNELRPFCIRCTKYIEWATS